MIAGSRARVCEGCPAVGAGVGASSESPGMEGRLWCPVGWMGTAQHFIQEGRVNSSFSAVNFEVKQKCLADVCVLGVVLSFF